jgi:hypothetical protein
VHVFPHRRGIEKRRPLIRRTRVAIFVAVDEHHTHFFRFAFVANFGDHRRGNSPGFVFRFGLFFLLFFFQLGFCFDFFGLLGSGFFFFSDASLLNRQSPREGQSIM